MISAWIALFWIIYELIRTIKDSRRFKRETLPGQLVQLIQQAHAGQSFDTEFDISVSANDREKLCYPLTAEQVEMIRMTPYHQCQWKKFSYRVSEYKYNGRKLSGIVLVTIRFQDDARNINLDYKNLPVKICLTCKPGEKWYVDSVEYI